MNRIVRLLGMTLLFGMMSFGFMTQASAQNDQTTSPHASTVPSRVTDAPVITQGDLQVEKTKTLGVIAAFCVVFLTMAISIKITSCQRHENH